MIHAISGERKCFYEKGSQYTAEHFDDVDGDAGYGLGRRGGK